MLEFIQSDSVSRVYSSEIVPVVEPFSELDSSEEDSDSDSSLKSDCSDSDADSSKTRVHNLLLE